MTQVPPVTYYQTPRRTGAETHQVPTHPRQASQMGKALSPPPGSAGHVGRAQVATAPHLECHLQEQWARTRMPSPLDLPAPTLGPRQPLTMAPSETRENDGCCCFVSPSMPPGLTHPACTGGGGGWSAFFGNADSSESSGGGFGRMFGYEPAQGPLEVVVWERGMFPCDLSSGDPSSDSRSWALIRSRTPDMGGLAILLPRPSPALSHLTSHRPDI